MKRFIKLSDERFEEIKRDLKELGFKIGRHKEQYANGGFFINATRKQEYNFTDGQLLIIQKYLTDNDLDSSTSSTLHIEDLNIDRLKLFYGRDIHYILPVKR